MQTILTILVTLTCVAVGIVALIGLIVLLANVVLGNHINDLDEEI